MKTAAVELTRPRAGTAMRARLYATRPVRLLAQKLRPRALALVYHRVGEPPIDPFGQAVSSVNFSDHLAVLQEHYRVAGVPDLVSAHRNHEIEDGTVVVSFDDGYADVHYAAAPTATVAGVPLHLFVTVRPILEGGRFWWDELAAAILVDQKYARTLRLDNRILGLDGAAAREEAYRLVHAMLKRLPSDQRRGELQGILSQVHDPGNVDLGRSLTADELRAFVATPGMSIGAHTLTHPSLAALPTAEQRRELHEGRVALQELVGRAVEIVAYPFGKEVDVSGETSMLAEEAGYVAGFTTMAKLVTPRADAFALPRLTVHDWPAGVFRQRLRAIFGF